MRDLFGESGATISPCGLYRYRLWRRWGGGRSCVFVMLNPSTADADQDDPTIRRCIGFARREGCGGLVVVNLFAFRATAPVAMKATADPVGPENDRHLRECIWGDTDPVIAAWGVHGTFRGRAADVTRRYAGRLLCLGLTKEGAPRHPLYLSADASLQALPVQQNQGAESRDAATA